MPKMNCDELVERVTDYLEGVMRPEDLNRLDDHLRRCYGCSAYIGEFQVTLRLVSSLPPEPMSGQLESSLLAAYRRWAQTAS